MRLIAPARLARSARVRTIAVGFSTVWLAVSVAAGSQGTPPTRWQCPIQPIEPCVKQHGRLSSQNGMALKIWLIGTKRVVGLDNDVDRLPAPLGKYLDMTSPDHSYIYGDFEICPTEPVTPGHLRRRIGLSGDELIRSPR